MERDFQKLWDMVVLLRGPNGCPWDRSQTLKTMKQELLEEVYELLDAVNQSDPDVLMEELGDVMLTLTMMLRIAQEEKGINPQRVIQNIIDKVVRLHPHVFQDTQVKTAEEALAQWETLRRREGKKRFQGIPRTFPALLRAQKMGERAARVGFDWPSAKEAWDKVQEEIQEIEIASKERQEEELGDLLFALAQWARLRQWNAEEVLHRACDKFAQRFERMQEMAEREGINLDTMDLVELEALWQRAKTKQQD